MLSFFELPIPLIVRRGLLLTLSLVLFSSTRTTTRTCAAAMNKVVYHGDYLYLQNNHVDNQWLTGAQGLEREQVSVQDLMTLEKQKQPDTPSSSSSSSSSSSLPQNSGAATVSSSFLWFFLDATKPRSGDCVKFGDTVWILLVPSDSDAPFYLTGCRFEDHVNVSTLRLDNEQQQEEAAEEEDATTTTKTTKLTIKSTTTTTATTTKTKKDNSLANPQMQWEIRSVVGNGTRHDADPARGECVRDVSLVYLQNQCQDHRWLTTSAYSSSASASDRSSSFDKKTVGTAVWTQNYHAQVLEAAVSGPAGVVEEGVLWSDLDKWSQKSKIQESPAALAVERSYQWILRKGRFGSGRRNDAIAWPYS